MNVPVGMPNLGNTCYANSIIQILASIPYLTVPKELVPKEGLSRDRYVLASNIYRLIQEIRDGNTGNLKPGNSMKPGNSSIGRTTILQAHIAMAKCYPSFARGQQDQNEYLNTLLSVLHDCSSTHATMSITLPDRPLTEHESLEVKGYQSMRVDGSSVLGSGLVTLQNDTLLKSSIFEYFTGQTLTQTCCTHCGHVSYTFDIFRTWDVSIPENATSLEDCLNYNTSVTQLGQEEQNECTKCKRNNPSYISRKLWNVPKVLVISLGRFCIRDGMMSKNINPIKIPEQINVSSYCLYNQSKNYELVAVAHHAGGLNSGHCYSSIKREEPSGSASWYVIDDEEVSKIDGPLSRHAYICFYACM